MKLGWWMLAGSALTCFGIVAVLGDEAPADLRLAVWLGMLGPLVASLCAMFVVSRAYRRDPSSLTRVMTRALIAKMVFFGGYIALLIKSGRVQPIPFAASFIGYFFALHIVEAFRLRHLFSNT
jgi:hypothetical protein